MPTFKKMSTARCPWLVALVLLLLWPSETSGDLHRSRIFRWLERPLCALVLQIQVGTGDKWSHLGCADDHAMQMSHKQETHDMDMKMMKKKETKE